MIKSVQELKEFITWCKTQKVKSVSIGDIKVELSDIALVEDLYEAPEYHENPKELVAAAKLEEEQQQAEDESLLFWSAE